MEHLIDFVESLRSKKVKVIEIPKWGVYLRKLWEDSFANHLSEQVKKSIYLYDEDGCCGYLWHVFSYEKKNCLKEKEADTAFYHVPKQSCYIFYQHVDDAYILENASSLTADDVMNEEDVYIVDKEFNGFPKKVSHTQGM
ncbi:DUF4275 family protein [Robertmurraya andreesenii]|uniref:DUF4275 family protein n=1 Tax=Anoxybacillus andreesenii TaxID=1325932 RepID=UPI0027D79A67|nr:DUF4275 family protein [Robertmurraya andreesenii]